jgi:lipid-binding SYLF domain-containing protein
MISQRTCIALVWAALVANFAGAVSAQEVPEGVLARRLAVDANAQAALNDLFKQREGTRALFDESQGYAVFSATKAGFFVTGGGGTGVAVNKTTNQRTYMRMGTGGIGLGIGAQQYDLVIFFEDQARLNRFIAGGWDASTNAQAAAGSDGVAYTSSFVDGIAIYQLTDRGLMAQADVSGTRFWAVNKLN